ncbi:hypothetical protein ACJIZ3_020899 [Penstemon smallii]|uniref:Uncharacterized protein n=1 Tax=Penstemon smallii TaxID=265156 RepID=A0ABD3SJW4_9LAMI
MKPGILDQDFRKQPRTGLERIKASKPFGRDGRI